MAKITTLIPLQNFEKVRDQIAIILADELSNQATLAGDQQINATVSSERFIPFDKTSMPALNVLLSRGNYASGTTIDADGVYTYFIDVYTAAKTIGTTRGDTLATTRLHRILGLVRAILEDTQYLTLGFTRPSIENTTVSDISIAEPSNNQDAASIIMGRVTFMVRVTETVKLLTGVPLTLSNTEVKLGLTDKGYIYENNN
jgi:hypothetical protein